MAEGKKIRIDINPHPIKEDRASKAEKTQKNNTDDVILYDLRKDDHPDQRGDRFRSLQVFECGICGAVTNSMLMGGYPGYGLRYYCPNGQEEWHKNLKEKIKLSRQPHPKFYNHELEKEIQEFRNKHAKDVKNDILGNPDFNLKEKGVWGEE